MAHLETLQLCEIAFLDSWDRLCLIGVMNRFPVPALPIAVHQLMLVARVVDARPGEKIDVGVSITAPSGLSPSPDDPECIEIANLGEYVMITLRQFPLHEEGEYRFSLSLTGTDTISLDIPVVLASRPVHAPVH